MSKFTTAMRRGLDLLAPGPATPYAPHDGRTVWITADGVTLDRQTADALQRRRLALRRGETLALTVHGRRLIASA